MSDQPNDERSTVEDLDQLDAVLSDTNRRYVLDEHGNPELGADGLPVYQSE